jgi:hypothetical protein
LCFYLLSLRERARVRGEFETIILRKIQASFAKMHTTLN